MNERTAVKTPQRVQDRQVRQKIWHRKTKNGCLTCKSRRVKCDERRPACDRCRKLSLECEYQNSSSKPNQTKVVITTARLHPELMILPSGEHDFQFYVYAGAPMVAQWQCPSFWLVVLPQASASSAAAKHGLLAISTSTQQFVQTSPHEIQLMARRGDAHYARACKMLTPELDVTVEEALSTSFTLWCYDWFFGRQEQSFIHANAAVKLFHSLESGDLGSWQSILSKESRSSMLEVARAFFHDMHFPLHNAEFLKMLQRRAQNGVIPSSRRKVDELSVSSTNPFAELATPSLINSYFWLVVVADSQEALRMILQALDDCAYSLANEALPVSQEQEIFRNQVSMFQLFCQLHLDKTHPHRQRDADEAMSNILNLIQCNMQLIENKDTSPSNIEQDVQQSGLSQHGIHCYLGVLTMIGKQAKNHTVRAQAFDLVASHGTKCRQT